MAQIDFHDVVLRAWASYDSSREIASITDISAKVSTNHVYRVRFKDGSFVVSKLSYFGRYDHFVEDHSIINVLANNLSEPFENVLAHSLMKKNELYTFCETQGLQDIWVVFYRPIKVKNKLPRRLSSDEIINIARQFARFHKACTTIRNTLPMSSKSMRSDIEELLSDMDTEVGSYDIGIAKDKVRFHCLAFLDFYDRIDQSKIPIIPVFVDWNIGNFSISKSGKLYSRWDYDWFRMSSRMADFYFFARIASDVGDRTVFTYNIDILTEDRFILFLKSYHSEYPLQSFELDMIPEMYRFFLLNYVIKYGAYFFHDVYAQKLKSEVYTTHLDSIESLDLSHLKAALRL